MNDWKGIFHATDIKEAWFDFIRFRTTTKRCEKLLPRIDEIIKITNVDKIMNNKNISFNNVIEEGGTNLSRGERQKIILARTLLRNNKIIILDEALNGLDFSEEKEILERIICKFKDSTIIYISHNRDLINLFDNIIEFKEGGIYEVIG